MNKADDIVAAGGIVTLTEKRYEQLIADTRRLDWLENAPKDAIYTQGFRDMFAYDPRGAIDTAIACEKDHSN